MQLLNHKKLHIVAGRATAELVADICRELDVVQGTPNIAEFANGEIHVKYGDSIRGSDVFIVQTHTAWDGRSINDSIMEHLSWSTPPSGRRPNASPPLPLLRLQPPGPQGIGP